MKVINFLPEDYLHRRNVRQANRICALIGAGALVVAGAAVGVVALKAAGVAQARAAMDQKYAEAGRQIKQMKELEDRKAGLLHKVEVSASLLERVPRSYILAHLTNNLPPHTSLTSIAMSAVDVDEVVAAPAAAGEKGDASGRNAGPPGGKSGGADKKKGPAKTKVKRLEFTLAGLAPTDVDVAEYIGRLCADPVFQEIDLKFSEEFPYKENVRMRRFEIVLRLNPKAEELLEKAPAEKAVTAAPPAPSPLARGAS